MTDLTDDDIRHLARLARISVSDQEVASFKTQLSSILGYVQQLSEVDVTGLAPTSQVTGLTNVTRDDQSMTDTVSTEVLLDQAPDMQDNQIKVPKVL